jgi:hypothetical protein
LFAQQQEFFSKKEFLVRDALPIAASGSPHPRVWLLFNNDHCRSFNYKGMRESGISPGTCNSPQYRRRGLEIKWVVVEGIFVFISLLHKLAASLSVCIIILPILFPDPFP